MSENFYKSANLSKDEKISMIDRFILLCLMLGVQGDSNISTISMDKISKYCEYTDSNGVNHPFGVKKVKQCLLRLEKTGRIRIIYPEKRGQCMKYEILLPEHYEKVSIEFCKQSDLSPAAKGYVLCNLQYNKNKDPESHQPNNIHTLCQYNIDEMKNMFCDSSGKIRRAEKELQDKGILSLQETSKKYSNNLPITERILNLDKLELGRFVISSLLDHEERLSQSEQTIQALQQAFADLLNSLGKDVLITKQYSF